MTRRSQVQILPPLLTSRMSGSSFFKTSVPKGRDQAA